MITETQELIPREVMADLELAAHCAATNQPPAPEFVRRIALEAEKIREEVKRTHGLLDIGVPAIRESRDS